MMHARTSQVAVLSLALCAAALARGKARASLLAAGIAFAAAGWRSGVEWAAVRSPRIGPVAANSRIVSDPDPVGGALVVVLEVEGQRFEAWTHGSPARRLRGALAGETVWIEGVRRAGPGGGWLASRHVVGRIELVRVGVRGPGPPLHRAVNRVRGLLQRGARPLGEDERSLFAGLVYGDDRHQSAELVAAFRASGLAHLSAVSGQNVGFLLAAAGPVLRRLAPWPRWLVTVGLLAWFATLTRFEPSVLRAVVMAGLGATAFVSGRDRSAARLLALAVVALVLVDPLLAWSVGWWMSVTAALGLSLLAAPLAGLLPGPQWLTAPLAVTLAAQLGVLPVTLVVFGWPPAVALPANLLAVPVAGAVMLTGIPAALVGANLPDGFAAWLLWLPGMGVRWVATVARLAARVPASPLDVAVWIGVPLALVRRTRGRAAAALRDPSA